MAHNGYTNEATFLAAIAIDNSRSFYFGGRAAAVAKALDGDTEGAAADLKQAAVAGGVFPINVDVESVDFAQLVTKAAEEAAR